MPLPSQQGSTFNNIFGTQYASGQNPEQTLLSSLLAGSAPQLDQGQLQVNLDQAQLGQVNSQVAEQGQALQQQATNQLANLGISSQQQGLQALGLQQQGVQQQAQQGFEQQQYQLQQGQFPEQTAEAQLAYNNALMQTQGQQAISGTQNTVGGKAQIQTLGQQLGFQLQDINRAAAQSQLGQKSELSGYQYSQEQLQNAQQNLGLMAKANGLSQQQVYQMLQSGQQQIGQQGQQDIIGLLGNMANAEIGNVSNAGAALSPIAFASGFNALAGQR